MTDLGNGSYLLADTIDKTGYLKVIGELAQDIPSKNGAPDWNNAGDNIYNIKNN